MDQDGRSASGPTLPYGEWQRVLLLPLLASTGSKHEPRTSRDAKGMFKIFKVHNVSSYQVDNRGLDIERAIDENHETVPLQSKKRLKFSRNTS